MMLPESQKHIFSVYIDQLSSLIKTKEIGDVVVIEDKKIYHRVVQILRLKPGDKCLFFDSDMYICLLIQELIAKKNIVGIIEQKKSNIIFRPSLTVILPLLKRDDLDAALYSLTAMGVTAIQLVITSKVQRKWGGEKEYERLKRVIIAAAEQSKNFAFPQLSLPQLFEEIILPIASSPIVKIYFDPNGDPLLSIIDLIKKYPSLSILLMIGPEGDLSPQEKEQLKKVKFLFCVLTPTILRASEAIALGAGIFRSIL